MSKPLTEPTNWYVLAFDGELGDRIVRALADAGHETEAAYVQSAIHVPAADAAPFIPYSGKSA